MRSYFHERTVDTKNSMCNVFASDNEQLVLLKHTLERELGEKDVVSKGEIFLNNKMKIISGYSLLLNGLKDVLRKQFATMSLLSQKCMIT